MTLSPTELGAILADLRPVGIEIHCNVSAELPKKYGRAIEAAGGTYSHARGYASKRIVWLPSSQGELIDAIVRDFGRVGANFERVGVGAKPVTMIVRGITDSSGDFPSTVTVHYIPKDAPSPSQLLLERFVLEVLRWRRDDGLARVGRAITHTEEIAKAQKEIDERLRHEANALSEVTDAVKRLRRAFEAGVTDEQLIAAAVEDNGSTLTWRINALLNRVEGKEV